MMKDEPCRKLRNNMLMVSSRMQEIKLQSDAFENSFKGLTFLFSSSHEM